MQRQSIIMETNKMCYVVQSSAGEHDDYRWWIEGIFNNPFDAENLKDIINNTMEIYKNLPEPFLQDANSKGWTMAQHFEYDNWHSYNSIAIEFNGAKVVEYPFGKSCR
ncbi:MAG: hypothetical protein RL308_3394 [Bacteroidota bacterium]